MRMTMNDPATTWHLIAAEGVADLYKAKEQMHQAVQLVAMVGRSFLPTDEDDSHANLEWLPSRAALAGQKVGKEKQYRAALRLVDLQYLIIDDRNQAIASYDLAGKTQEEAFNWFKSILGDLGFDINRLSMKLPYPIPASPTSNGEPFQIDNPSAFKVLAGFFANAHLLLLRLQAENSNVSTIRCWPHHFDIAALISLEDNQSSENSKSIGIGFSPGDEEVPEPYFYVNGWPYPDLTNQELPAISTGGKWNLEGWIGTTLTYTKILGATDQYTCSRNFFNNSIRALKQLMV